MNDMYTPNLAYSWLLSEARNLLSDTRWTSIWKLKAQKSRCSFDNYFIIAFPLIYYSLNTIFPHLQSMVAVTRRTRTFYIVLEIMCLPGAFGFD
jgi:hypothetical protein